MKKLLFASCAILSVAGGSTSALAGDLRLAGSTYDWSGGYVGMVAGAYLNTTTVNSNYVYAGNAEITDSQSGLINDLDFKDTADDAGFTGGLLAGYNWQYGNFVLGAEADVNYIGLDHTSTHDVSATMGMVMSKDPQAADKVQYTADWFGTVRARLGYAADKVLIYGTGGLAYGQLDAKQKLHAENDASESASWTSSANGWNAGWTVGGGIEYAMDRWVLGAEYLYVDLGSYNWGANGKVDFTDSTNDGDFGNVKQKSQADVAFSVARASLKYRF